MQNARTIEIGSSVLDLTTRNLHTPQGQVIHLSQKSVELLKVLIEFQGQMVSRNTLIDLVWSNNYIVGSHRIYDEIWKIRNVLKRADISNVTLQTVPRKGYILNIFDHDPGKGLSRNSGGVRPFLLLPILVVFTFSALWVMRPRRRLSPSGSSVCYRSSRPPRAPISSTRKPRAPSST
jgi:DNA-binding winged helix-turn-helix (wHTH) protein